MKMLQVCNVGNICGGTAACAWTITKALPQWRHEVCFLSPVTRETQSAFEHATLRQSPQVNTRLLRESGADVVLLHNVHSGEIDAANRPLVIQYHHSAGKRLASDLHVSCSKWLANQVATSSEVLYQPVPIPGSAGNCGHRCFDDELVVGRICTPTSLKWPTELVPFYSRLASHVPNVRWEFVGAPQSLQKGLTEACRGRAEFHSAGWDARLYLRRWHVLLYHHPTLTESFGRTVAEAMRGGCVPVVDDRGGFQEQIESGETGYLCQDGDDFLSALEALQSPSLRWKQARASKQRADRMFSMRAFAEQFYSLLESPVAF